MGYINAGKFIPLQKVPHENELLKFGKSYALVCEEAFYKLNKMLIRRIDSGFYGEVVI